MYEHSNISSAAALREARRKKILENSAYRLKLIEGINSSLGKASTESYKKSNIESEVRISEAIVKETSNSDLNSKFNNIIKNNKELKEISDYLLQHFDQIHEDEDEDENENESESEKENEKEKVEDKLKEECVITSTSEQKKGNMFFKTIFQKRLHYVFLAITVNILFFFNAGYIFFENILCPFYTVKVVELLSKRDEKNFQPVLFLFITGLPKRVQRYTKIILTVLGALFSDLCLYLFTFIIGTKIINSLE